MLDDLAQNTCLGSLVAVIAGWGAKHLDSWKQGEFHHDFVFGLENCRSYPTVITV